MFYWKVCYLGLTVFFERQSKGLTWYLGFDIIIVFEYGVYETSFAMHDPQTRLSDIHAFIAITIFIIYLMS